MATVINQHDLTSESDEEMLAQDNKNGVATVTKHDLATKSDEESELDEEMLSKHNNGVITEQPSSVQGNRGESKYLDEYRVGNFGVTLGKLDLGIGKRWNLVLCVSSLLSLVLTICGHIVLSKNTVSNSIIIELALAFTWCTCILTILLTLSLFYINRKLPSLNHPYAVLIWTRFIAIFNCIFISFTMIFVGIIIGIPSDNKTYVNRGEDNASVAVKAIYALLLIIDFVIFIGSCTVTSSVACAVCCDELSCCGHWCMYGEGTELAPGVPDPPSQEKWALCVDILGGVHKGLEDAA